jgi:sec-independent protein translocase protein TatA
MFGIGGGELIFILFIVLMLFGSDKVPEIARTMGKAMAQLKNATNDIKSEIQNGADANGLDQNILSNLRGNINSEINNVKTNLLGDSNPLTGISDTFSTEVSKVKNSVLDNTKPQVNQLSEDIEDAIGPIKRSK